MPTVETAETRRRMRVGPRYPYTGPEDFFGPGWPVEYMTSGLEHEFVRDDAMPSAINRETLAHETVYTAQRIGGE